jgi:hypothetical protein
MNQGAIPKADKLGYSLFRPDYTVGFGITPNLLTSSLKSARGLPAKQVTASGELHPALRCSLLCAYFKLLARLFAYPPLFGKHKTLE